MQVGSGLGGDGVAEVMGDPAIILDVAVALRWRTADPGATGSTNKRKLEFLIARRNEGLPYDPRNRQRRSGIAIGPSGDSTPVSRGQAISRARTSARDRGEGFSKGGHSYH